MLQRTSPVLDYPAAAKLEYCLSKNLAAPRVRQAVSRIKEAYERDYIPWVIGYSGGKDSSAILKLTFHALRLVEFHHKPVTVIYCDTGVEIPAAATLARGVMHKFEKEARGFNLPISTRILQPRLEDRFFVKIIGRGYPPPTDKFRWCTDRLRINPVSAFLKSAEAKEAVVVLGVRQSESATRNHTLSQNSTHDQFWKKQKNHYDRLLFMPILDFTIEDVWRTLLHVPTPFSVDGAQVANLYAAAAGECPTLRDPVSPPCGRARFGCWSCTVAKKSQTLQNLSKGGQTGYAALENFRQWMLQTRNYPSYRWKSRRNGSAGPGPMTLKWRRMALERIFATQEVTDQKLIEEDEVELIRKYWSYDRRGQN
jgi:DNA sulfur modification protein DndC